MVFELFTILKGYGWAGIVIALFLFAVYKAFNASLLILGKKIHGRFFMNSKKSLQSHTFFATIQHMIDVSPHSSEIFENKPVRQALVRDLMYCSLTSMQEFGLKMVNEDHCGWAAGRWAFKTKSYVTEMHSAFISKCIRKGIPRIVYMRYMVWFFDHMTYMRGAIDQIAYDTTYPTVGTKTSTILMMYTLILSTLMADSESVLLSLNGDITGKKYNGAVIEDCN